MLRLIMEMFVYFIGVEAFPDDPVPVVEKMVDFGESNREIPSNEWVIHIFPSVLCMA